MANTSFGQQQATKSKKEEKKEERQKKKEAKAKRLAALWLMTELINFPPQYFSFTLSKDLINIYLVL